MRKTLTVSVKIIFCAIIVSGIFACHHKKDQNVLCYSIPYINTGSSQSGLSEISAMKDYIPIYADQYGKAPGKSDLTAEFNAAWCSEGLLVFCHVNDNQFYADTTDQWKSDALEIFLAPFQGSNDIIQLTVLPFDNPVFKRAFIYEKSYRTTKSIRDVKINASAVSKRTGTQTYFKVLIPLNGLGIIPAIDTKLAMQLYVSDSDIKSEQIRNQLQWHPIGNSYLNSLAMYELVFTSKGEVFPVETSKCYIKDNDSIKIIIYSNTLRTVRLLISHNNKPLISSENISSFPLTIALPLDKINPDRDTLKIFLNKNLISVHDLFNVPRKYEKIQAPGGFEKDIRFFEARDRLSFPPENAVLFIGSSSIKRWYNIKDYFPKTEIIHRGFGGSTASDALIYMNRIVVNYRPSKIFYYEGDNDIAKGYTTEKIIAGIDSFITIVHKNLPGTEIYIIPPKPSYARYHLWDKYLELNSILAKLSEKYSFVSYVDVVTPMFDEKGILRRDIFVEDNLHLNEKGYEI